MAPSILYIWRVVLLFASRIWYFIPLYFLDETISLVAIRNSGFRKKKDADDQAVKVNKLAAEVEQFQAAISEMSKLRTDKETKLENTMRDGSWPK